MHLQDQDVEFADVVDEAVDLLGVDIVGIEMFGAEFKDVLDADVLARNDLL